MNMIPKPLKRLIKTQTQRVATSFKNTVQGLLEGMAPGRVVHFLQVKATAFLLFIRNKVIAYIKSKTNRSPAADREDVTNRNDKENENQKRSSNSNSHQQKQEVERDFIEEYDDLDIDVDIDFSPSGTVENDKPVLVSA